MNQPLLTFQRFNDIGLANEFAERLTELGIYCEIDNQTVPFDVTYANNPLENDIRIKLHPGDFTKANAVLDEYSKASWIALIKIITCFHLQIMSWTKLYAGQMSGTALITS